MQKVKYPFGDATRLTPAHAATHNITIENQLTFIKLTGMTGAPTINLTPGADLEPGAQVVIDVVQGATERNVTLGTNIVALDLTGVANDRDRITLTWDGAEFIGGAWQKIVDAA